jgi:micrococcal nuclease
MYNYAATAMSVIDGDTVRLDIDLGFGITSRQVVRLMGINAPELHGQPDPEPGRAAKAFLEGVLYVGAKVRVNTFKDKREKYGRLLAAIWIGEDVTSVNQRMLDAGHAKSYSGGARE